MEPPAPLGNSIETPKDNLIYRTPNNKNLNQKSLIGSTDFKFLYQNKSFIVTISMTSDRKYLNLQSKEEGNFIYFYESQKTLEELIKFDKIFKTCDDIEDSLNSMIVIFKGEKNKIKEITDNKLVLSINIIQLDGSFKSNDIELLKKNPDKDIIIDNLCKIVYELKSNNINLKNELKDVKQKIEKLEKIVNIHDFRLYSLDSNIIKEKKDFDFIIERLKKLNENADKINLNLIYRGSRDGDEASDFHSKCDKFQNTLILVKTKKGLRFGGFTSQSWEGNGDKIDKNAFCFSLDKLKIYNIIKDIKGTKEKPAIFTSPQTGPFFGNCVFEIKDSFFEMGGLCSEDYFYDNQQIQCEINNGEEQFDIDDVEVFKVSF